MRALCGILPTSVPPSGAGIELYGVHPASYTGKDCTGCGICFYCCPEPGAITVYQLRKPGRLSGNCSREAAMPQLCKGNVAVVKGAVLAGCRPFRAIRLLPRVRLRKQLRSSLPSRWNVFAGRE